MNVGDNCFEFKINHVEAEANHVLRRVGRFPAETAYLLREVDSFEGKDTYFRAALGHLRGKHNRILTAYRLIRPRCYAEPPAA